MLKRIFNAMGFVVLFLCLGSTGQNVYATCSGNCAGWEAVNNYHGYAPNLSKCCSEGQKFEAAIYAYSSSWIVDFSWCDDSAWEQDFKVTSMGGTDIYYADDVDLTLFAGHGSPTGFYFGTTQDDHQLHYSEADWGDQDLEWIILDACQILQDNASKWARWGSPVFKGLHYILGYNTTTYDVDTRGEDFIKRAMYYGNTVRDSWISATILSENNTEAAYMRANSDSANTYYDHLWGFGWVSSDPITPITLYYLTWNT